MNIRSWITAIMLANLITLLGSLTHAGSLSETSSTPRQIVIISDLHLGVGKVGTTKHWHPTEDFRWSKQFVEFLEQIAIDGKGETDLIINGDLFELWQSTQNDCLHYEKPDYGCTEEEALERLKIVLNFHDEELKALGKFSNKDNNRLIILPGNHDAALLFPMVKDAALQVINGGERVYFAPKGFWLSEDGLIYIEHGHQIGHEVNKWDQWPHPFLERDGKRHLQRTWGEQFVQSYYNRLEIDYPIIDNLSSEAEGVKYAIAAEGPVGSVKDVIGFLKFYLMGVSWSQFKLSLGKEEDVTPPEWDLEAIRHQNSKFLMESLPTDHPLYPYVLSLYKNEQLIEMAQNLSEEDINNICNQRSLLYFLQGEEKKHGLRPDVTIKTCPKIDNKLGAAIQSIVSSADNVLGEHLVYKVYPAVKEYLRKPFKVYIFSHTHLVIKPRELSLSSGYWKPTVINSGAWQRVATPRQLEAIREEKNLPKDEVLPKLQPEDLPPCYSYVLIEPYKNGEIPKPYIKYWIGEEDQIGNKSDKCGL